MTTKKRSTMKDVARQAGVTIGTVSNLINQKGVVAEATARKIERAIQELEYVPNFAARSIRAKKNRMVGLLLPNLTNHFYSRIAGSFVEQAEGAGYMVLIMGYEYSLDREKRAMKGLFENNVGTIVIANGHDDEKYIQRYMRQGIRFVLADRRTELSGVSYVEFDNLSVMGEVIRLLKGKGYRRIGYLSEPLELTNIRDRFDGYCRAMKEYGYPCRNEDIFITGRLCLNKTENGYLFVKELLSEKTKAELPDAFIFSSDLAAFGGMKAIQEAGYRIPEDFGIVGCDNLQMSGFVSPRLTTINQDRKRMGEELWKVVRAKSEGRNPANVKIGQQLVVRESC